MKQFIRPTQPRPWPPTTLAPALLHPPVTTRPDPAARQRVESFIAARTLKKQFGAHERVLAAARSTPVTLPADACDIDESKLLQLTAQSKETPRYKVQRGGVMTGMGSGARYGAQVSGAAPRYSPSTLSPRFKAAEAARKAAATAPTGLDQARATRLRELAREIQARTGLPLGLAQQEADRRLRGAAVTSPAHRAAVPAIQRGSK